MTCNCNELIIKSTSIVMSGSQLVINIPAVTLTNHQKFKLVLCQTIPSTAGVSQVILATPTQTFNMFVVTGNYLRADQIRCRRCFDMVYGNNPVHVSMRRCLPESCYDVAFPTGSSTTASATSSVASTTKKTATT